MKYTQATLNKIEQVLDEASYIVRYERGTFQSGYCILEQKKVVVLNKFLPLAGRINTLVDIIPQLNIVPDDLSPEARKTYNEILERVRLAAEEESRAAAPDSADATEATEQPEQPEQPGQPDQPEQPGQPDQPEQPEQPDLPVDNQ